MNSTLLYNVSTAGYVASLAVFAVHLIRDKKLVLRLGVFFVALSFFIQTMGMLLRWIEAGHLEVGSTEKAVGFAISGWSWWVVFTQHPPWSNLYEIMVYMSWGIVLVTLAAEIKWHLALIRQLGVILALFSLGLASLTDSSIKPLVPALKSWWIMIHVISASIAYAAGFIAAFVCFLCLIKDEKRIFRDKLTAVFLASVALLIFCLGGGVRLIVEQKYYVKLLANAGERVTSVFDIVANGSKPFLVAMPYVGGLFLFLLLFHLLSAIFILIIKKNIKAVTLLNCCVTFFTVIFVIALDLKKAPIILAPQSIQHLSLPAPYFISFQSHSWSFGLLCFVLLLEVFFTLCILFPKFMHAKLPEVNFLESVSYKTISLSFFLMTIVLITGALWAHYAWGRYWAWDPKETGALAIWLNYAIYLHTKKTSGWSGPFSSFIGILGFFIIIVGFLGVNLGLFADGLHTYGNS